MINQLTILGHLGQNATVKHANGTTITKFSVATKKSWKDENNELLFFLKPVFWNFASCEAGCADGPLCTMSTQDGNRKDRHARIP